MLYAIRGKVSEIEKKFVVIETTDFDYEIFVSRPNDFLIGEYIYLYLHHHIKEDCEYLCGFRNLEEKNAFKLLLNVQGVGPKSALAILANVNYDDFLVAVSNNDLDFIKSIPGVGERVANQILLDLSNYIMRSNKENSTLYKEVKEALKSLKFKVKEIDKVLPRIYIPDANRDSLLKEALRRLSPNE